MTSDEKEKSTDHSSPVTHHSPLPLPHRPPFVFVRKLNRCEAGTFAECETVFPPNEPMFAGHFPDDPLVPGVILTEALAQTAGICAASGYPEESHPRFLLSAIRQMKFFEAVRPDQRIILQARKSGEIGGLIQFEVQATVDQKIVASGLLVLNRVK